MGRYRVLQRYRSRLQGLQCLQALILQGIFGVEGFTSGFTGGLQFSPSLNCLS